MRKRQWQITEINTKYEKYGCPLLSVELSGNFICNVLCFACLSCNFHDQQMDRDREIEGAGEHGRGYRNLKRDHVCLPKFQGEPSVWNFRCSFLSIFKVILMTNAPQQNHKPTTYRLPHKTAPSLSNFAAPCTKTDDEYKAQTCVNIYIRWPS